MEWEFIVLWLFPLSYNLYWCRSERVHPSYVIKISGLYAVHKYVECLDVYILLACSLVQPEKYSVSFSLEVSARTQWTSRHLLSNKFLILHLFKKSIKTLLSHGCSSIYTWDSQWNPNPQGELANPWVLKHKQLKDKFWPTEHFRLKNIVNNKKIWKTWYIIDFLVDFIIFN